MVVLLDEVVDFGDEVFEASESVTADCLLGNETEPWLDLIEPLWGTSGCQSEKISS